MAKLGPSGILSLVVAVVGVLFYIAAVGGLLFEKRTPPGDIGALSVALVLVTLGLLGVWAHLAERKQEGH